MTTAAASRAIGRWTKFLVSVALGWISLVLIVAIVQSTTYSGFVATLTEWQFDHLGQAFPAMTFLLLLALFSLPGLLLLGFVIRHINAVRDVRTEERVIQRSARMLRVLTVITVLLTIAIVIVLVQWAKLPDDNGNLKRVDVSAVTGTDALILTEGATRLIGQYRYDRTATFRQNVLVARRDYRFVPVQASGLRPTSIVRVFAETSASPDNLRSVAEERVGVLRRGSLPPAITHLYRDAGFRVAPDAYVLYSDRRALTWPCIAVAIQLAIAVVLLAIAALLTRRRLHLLRGQLVELVMAVS